MLGDKPWLLGDRRTPADAYFIGIARWNEYHQVVDVKDFPNLCQLYSKLEADPAVIFAHSIEDRKPAFSTGGFLGEVTLEDALALLDNEGAIPMNRTGQSLTPPVSTTP